MPPDCAPILKNRSVAHPPRSTPNGSMKANTRKAPLDGRGTTFQVHPSLTALGASTVTFHEQHNSRLNELELPYWKNVCN